jgi:hypothetical protein
MGKQTLRQAARLAASEVHAKRRREPAERDRAPGEAGHRGVDCPWRTRCHHHRPTEQRAGAALQAMITDESLTVSEAVQWCAGAISQREAARLRQLTAQAHNSE